MIVDTCWGPREVEGKEYWHIVPTQGTNAMLFYNNVRVGRGALLSVSAGIEAEPHLENAHTPYSLSRMNDEKESLFEDIRGNKYPMCPPRLKTIYLFDDYVLVEKALNEWFQGEARTVHECRILSSSIIHKADTVWLNCYKNNWEECANKYWSSTMSDSPFPEVRVHGAVYFPGFANFPDPAGFQQ